MKLKRQQGAGQPYFTLTAVANQKKSAGVWEWNGMGWEIGELESYAWRT